MIKVYLADIGTEWGDAELNQYMGVVPHEMQDKILRYRGWKERQSRITGKLLLLRLIKYFSLNLSLHDLQHTTFNKPFFAGNFDFSIAHSGDLVICAGTLNSKIGADIELITPIELSDYREQLHPNEWEMIQTATDQQRIFYEIWTKKEALLKATGRGMDMGLGAVDVLSDKINIGQIAGLNPQRVSNPLRIMPWRSQKKDNVAAYYFRTFTDIKDYTISIATSAPCDIRSVSFEALSDLLSESP